MTNGGCVVAGCDVGSLTSKAVILEDDHVVATALERNLATPAQSAEAVLDLALSRAGMERTELKACVATGYGRFEIPFASVHASEITCHAVGVRFAAPGVNTVLDIGGQDCKAISLDDDGNVHGFQMNDKCAAGTGRCLEVLAEALGLDVTELGPAGLSSRGKVSVSNKCSVFMELDVQQLLHRGVAKKDIAWAICDAVAQRAAKLVGSLGVKPLVCISGGVSKNACVVDRLAQRMGTRLVTMSVDAQLAGALGAAVLAAREATKPCG